MVTVIDLIERIERTTADIYRASTFTSQTQAQLRRIQADLDVLKTAVPAGPVYREGWDQ